MQETNVKRKEAAMVDGQLDRYCRNNRLSFLASLLISAVLLIAMWGQVAHTALLAWLGVLLLTQAAQFWFSKRYLRAGVQAEWEQRGWMPGLMVAAIATGAAWGGAFFMLGLSEGHPVAVLMIFVIAGITAYAGVAKSDVFPLALAFEAATILPMCLWLFMQSGTVAHYMGLIGLLYLLLLNFLLRQLSGMVRRVRDLSEENTDLSTALQRVEMLEYEGAMFRSMFEMISDPAIAVHDPQDDMRIVYANAAACRHFGVDAEAVLTLRPGDFDVRIDDEKRALLRERLAQHGRFAFQSVHRRANGEEVPVEVLINMFEHEGTTLGVTFIRNIASRLAAEKRMQELELETVREQEFRALAANLPVAVIRYDNDQRRVYVNPAAERMLHGDAATLLGGQPGEGGVPATAEMIAHYRNGMAEVLAGGEARELEFVLDDLPLSEQEYFAVRFAPERDEQGGIVGVLATWFDITERKRLEEQIRMKGHALDHSSEAMYLIGEQGRFVYVNEQACRALGYSREELLTLGVPDIDPEYTAPLLADRSDKVQREGGSFIFETRHRRSDGTQFPVEIQISELNYNGQVLGMALVRDLSERKRAEQALAESAQMLRDVLQGIPDPVWMKDADGAFVVCNHGVSRLFNMPVDEIIGKDDFDFFPPEQAEFYQNKDRAALEAGQVLVNEEWWTFGDNGEQALMETCKTPVRSPDGKLLGVLGIARDITERKRMAEILDERERSLQEAQRIAHVGSWDVDIANDRLTWSDETFRIWEIDKTKFKADFAAFLDTVHPEDRERVARVYNESIANRSLYEVEHRLLFPDGRVKHILERGEPQYDEQGKPVRFIGTSLDVTERKLAESALQQSEMKFRTLYDSTGDAVMLLDERGFFDCNAAALKIFGCATREEFCSKHPADLSPEKQPCGTDSLQLANRHIEQALQAGSLRFEWVHKNADNNEAFPAEVLLSSMALDGKPVLQATVRDISERKDIENTLRDSERRLQEAQRIAQVGSWALDLVSGSLEWSDEIFRIFEIDPQQFGASYEAFLEAIHPDDREAVNAAYTASLESRQPYSIDHRLLFADGRIKHVRECCETQFDAAGKPLRSSGTVQDITDLKQMEIELKKRERAFRSLAGNIPDNIARFDTAGRYLYVNPTHERLLGKTLEELIGRTIPDSHVQVKAAVAQVVATGQAIHAIRQPVMVNGIEELHDVSIVPELDEAGNVISVLGVGRDMTALHRLQDRLSNSEQEYRTLAENLPAPIIRYDAQGRRRYLNPAAEMMMRTKADAVLGRPQDDTAPASPAMLQRYRETVGQVLATREVRDIELVLDALPESLREHYAVRFVPDVGADGQPGVMAIGFDITALKKLEADLAVREAEFRSLAENSPDPIYRYDRTCRRIYANSAVERLTGIPREAMLGKSPTEFVPVPSVDAIKAQAVIQSVLDSGQRAELELTFTAANGQAVSVHNVFVPEFDAEGAVQSVLCLGRDITERKRFEVALQERSNLLHSVLESSPEVIVFALDRNYRYLSFNGKHRATMEAIWGKDIAVGTSMLDVIGSHPDREVAKIAFDRSLAGESFVEEQAFGDDARSREYWQTFYSPIRSDSGDVVGLTCFVMNISERRRMEDALAERQAFLDSLFEAIPVPVFYKDREGRYQGFNRAYETVFGADRAQLIGKSVFDTHPKDLAETYHAKDAEVFERRVELQQYEYQIKHADGTLREVLFSKAAFADSHGEVKGLIGAVIDITERKQNEAELQNRYAQIIQLNERLEQNARHLEEQTVELEYSQTQLKDALEFTEGIINAIPDLLFEVDRQGRYLNVWAQNPELLAAQKSALLSRTINEVLAPESAAICMSAIQEAEESGASFGKVFRLELPDGEHWFEISVSLQAGKATPSARFLMLSRDVTVRIQAEAELQNRYQQIIQLNERLEQNARDLEDQTVEMEAAQEQLKESLEFTEGIINAIPDILFEMDRDGTYLNVWTQNREVLADQKKFLVGKRVDEILSPQAAEISLAAIREAYEQGFAYGPPIAIEQLNGETRWYEYSLARKPSKGRDTVIALSRDITSRMQTDIVLEEMRQRLHSVVQTIPDMVWLKDADGVYLSCNSAFERFFGASEAEIVGKTDYDFVDKELADFFRQKDGEAIAAGCMSINDEWVTMADSGARILVETRKVPVYGADGKVVGVLGVGRDITERKRMEEALVQREQEFRTLVENSTDTVARYDRKLRRVYANPAFGELVAGGVAALVGKRPAEVPGGEGAMVYEEKLGEVLDSGKSLEFEMKWHSKDGREVCSLINLTPEFGAGGQVETVLTVGRDISELHAFRQKIHQMAFYDPLTALPNRALFNDRLRQMIADASWHGQLAGVMMIDMDRFKAVNDTMGHAVGDELLRETGARLSSCVRAYDTVARLGGDEFAVLLPDVRNADDLGSIADKMRAMFDEPFLLEGKEVFVSCSIGIALYPDDSIAPDDLVKYADSAMYFAKRSGRNNFRFYASELTEHANERLTLESELRRALERKELSLHFQPKVRLADGVMNGSEALLRWHHPQHGFVPPDKFIPIAEDSGLIIELGVWVLREACRMACEMNGAERPLHKVAINLSARQFMSNDLLQTVTAVLEETGCYPEWIELEITESLLLDEEGEVLEVLNSFRALGITIAIDDFGTGYSALSYLARFPINTLKIDRSFIRSITTDNYRAELVKAILSIAHCLGQQVVAEGVETAEQALFLQAHGCQVAQGYLYSKPVPRTQLLALPPCFELEQA